MRASCRRTPRGTSARHRPLHARPPQGCGGTSARDVETDAGFRGIANALAWILATNPDGGVRDGAEAARLAGQAVQATGGANPAFLNTLGAAYAEQGRFEEGVKAATQALDLARKAGIPEMASRIEAQLELYKAQKPYRENLAGNAP